MWETFTAREKVSQERSSLLLEIFLPLLIALLKVTAVLGFYFHLTINVSYTLPGPTPLLQEPPHWLPGANLPYTPSEALWHLKKCPQGLWHQLQVSADLGPNSYFPCHVLWCPHKIPGKELLLLQSLRWSLCDNTHETEKRKREDMGSSNSSRHWTKHHLSFCSDRCIEQPRNHATKIDTSHNFRIQHFPMLWEHGQGLSKPY